MLRQHARSPFWSLLRCSQRCLFSFNPRGTHSVEFRDSIVATAAFLCTFTAILLVLEIQGVALTRVLRALLLDSLGPADVVHGSWHVPLPISFGFLKVVSLGSSVDLWPVDSGTRAFRTATWGNLHNCLKAITRSFNGACFCF